MDLLTVAADRGWTSGETLTVAIEALDRKGRSVALAEWVADGDPEWDGADFHAVAAGRGWDDVESLAVVLAFAEDSGCRGVLDAHARRVARANPPDPDHYG
jgi:hypothetical protein